MSEKKYFFDSEPRFKGNIFTDKQRSPIKNLSKKSNEFVAFKVISNFQNGDENSKGSSAIHVRAFGAWARYILENPEYFAPGKRVHVQGRLSTDIYEYDKDMVTVDGEEVTVQNTIYNTVVTVTDQMGSNGFIAPCFQFEDYDEEDNSGRSSRRRASRDEDEAPARSRRRRASRDEDEDEDEAPARPRRGRVARDEDEDEDEAPARPRRGRVARDEDEDEAPARPRRGRRRVDGI